MSEDAIGKLIDLGGNGFLAVFLWLLWDELKRTNAWIRDLLLKQDAAAAEREKLKMQIADLEIQMQSQGVKPRDTTQPRRPL